MTPSETTALEGDIEITTPKRARLYSAKEFRKQLQADDKTEGKTFFIIFTCQ